MLSNESSTEFLELKNQIVEAASDVLLQVQDNLMPAYEKQLFEQVHAQIMVPHEQQVSSVLEAMREEIESTKQIQQKQESSTREQIQLDLKADREQRALLKSQKPPSMNQSVSQRFEQIEQACQDTVMAQEQITEEVNKFQESFEELVKRIELLEGQQKRSTTDKRLDSVG